MSGFPVTAYLFTGVGVAVPAWFDMPGKVVPGPSTYVTQRAAAELQHLLEVLAVALWLSLERQIRSRQFSLLIFRTV